MSPTDYITPEGRKELLPNAKRHYQQLAPHVKVRDTSWYLLALIEQVDALEKQLAEARAEVHKMHKQVLYIGCGCTQCTAHRAAQKERK